MNTWWFNYFVYDDVNIDLIYSFSNINHLMFFSHPMQWMSLWGIYHSISHSGSRYEIYIGIPPYDTLCSGFHCETYISIRLYMTLCVLCFSLILYVWTLFSHSVTPSFSARHSSLIGATFVAHGYERVYLTQISRYTLSYPRGRFSYIYIVDGVQKISFIFRAEYWFLEDLWQKPEVLQIICGSVRVKHITANNDTDV